MTEETKDERRSHQRFELWFPVRLQAEDTVSMGVLFDVSHGGLLMASGSEFEPGAKITIVFDVPPGSGNEHEAVGTVVRMEANDADPHGLWPNRLAIQFDEEVPGIEAVLRAHVERSSQPG